MSFYDPFKALPARFIALGALVPIKLYRDNAATFNPASLGPTTTPTPTEINGHGAMTLRRSTASDGTLKITNVAKLTIEPKINDRLLIGSDSYRVTAVAAMAPDGTAIMYEAVLA